jgi:hypothetical protein
MSSIPPGWLFQHYHLIRNMADILGARAVGMHAHHFGSINGLRSELSRNGFSI